MKKILMVVIFFMLASGGLAKVGSPDSECIDRGFDFGIVKWEWAGNSYMVSEEGVRSGYEVSIDGNATTALWTSSPGANGALAKGGQNYYTYAGGSSGTSHKSDLDNKDISHITLCGDEIPDAPEFGTLGALAALAGIGGFLAKRAG